MSWIKTISYKDATGVLKKIYNRVKGPDNNVDNVLMIHSLRPHTLKGHMELYKSVIHHKDNTLPKWYLEFLGSYVSHLNVCDYCLDHHSTGMSKLLADDERYSELIQAITNDRVDQVLNVKYRAGAAYAKKLTLYHKDIVEADMISLRTAGYTDGEILEVNQLASYFNYVNRMVVGLGVNTTGDIIGLSPGDNEDPDNWSHV
jgi:uncharacterized peroxidase-related enzyme